MASRSGCTFETTRLRIFTVYGEHEANVSIETGEVIEGSLPKAAGRLVKEWALERQQQLLAN